MCRGVRGNENKLAEKGTWLRHVLVEHTSVRRLHDPKMLLLLLLLLWSLLLSSLLLSFLLSPPRYVYDQGHQTESDEEEA